MFNLTSPPELMWGRLVIRLATERDRPALERLAALDSAERPKGSTLLAEQQGSMVAALSLTDGTEIADPFHPTAAIRELLQLRARQLRASAEGL